MRGGQPGRGVGDVERRDETVAVVVCFVGELPVGQVHDAGAGVVQPGVAAAQADEVLVEAVGVPAVGGEVSGGRGEGGADGIVAARAVFFDAAECLLVAVINGWRAARGEEDRERVRQVPGIA